MSFNSTYADPAKEKADFDRGQRALDRFRRLLSARYGPLLRAVTGNEQLKVEPHASGAFTDNKTVWLPVPLALGDETLEHNRDLCGQRDASSMKMLCGMCKVEDETDGLVFHESAHITEQSFATMRKSDVIKTVDKAFGAEIMKLDKDKQQALTKRLQALRGSTVMEVAGVLDTWMPFALNCVEDVYVNRRLFANRLGTELPLRILTREVFENGIENASTGATSDWKDNDPSAQALISMLLIGQGLPELGSYLDPACDLTSDPELVKLAGEIPADCEVEDRLVLAGRLVTYLRTLGFCPPKADDVLQPPAPPSPPEGDPEPPQGGEGDPEPGQGAQGEPEDSEGDDSSEGDGSGDTEDADDGEDADGSDDGDDEAGMTASDKDAPSKGADGDEEDSEGDESAKGGDEADDSDESDDGTPSKGVDGDEEAEASDTKSEAEREAEESQKMRDLQAETEAEIEEQARRAKELLTYVMGHGDSGPSSSGANSQEDASVLERVLVQEDFDSPSAALRGGYEFVDAKTAVEAAGRKPHPVSIPRNLLSPSLARLRVVFASNRKTGIERNLRSGSRLDTMHLYRAGQGDSRIFGRKNVPKSRDWFVCVGLDFSGSTSMNGADHATKKAAHAVGELLYELGIRFAMYSHSSGYTDKGESVRHVEIKSPEANWKDSITQDALFASRGGGVNLDGHSMEQYRKVVQSQRATDKLMLYFTDGEMPAANFTEELELLQENIKLFKRDGCDLLGIGYRTDSPKRHGLETIQYNHEDDIKSIVDGLEAHLR